MTFGPPDQIESTIDEVLASVVAGEPRRVNATSVRRALNESGTSRIPLWLAVAAVLLAGFVLSIRTRGPISEAPGLATNRPTIERSLESAVEKLPSPALVPAFAEMTRATTSAGPARGSGGSRQFDEPREIYEGLPRLTIAFIEPPLALSTIRLEADAIQIPRIEIAPLFVSSLSIEPEHNQ